MRKIITFFAFIQLLSQPVQAQYGDCISAKDICKKEPVRISSPYGEGKDRQEADFMHCFMNGDNFGQAEENSTWIKFEVKESGTFAFTITPDNPSDDIDFVVFRIPGGDCKKKEVVRCMASGDMPGNYPGSRCLGKTGLRAGELDSSADAGCTDKDDNTWLAPLKTSKGEHYAILISNVTGPRGFSISFSGTAKLPCEEEKPLAKAEKKAEKKQEKKTVKENPQPPVVASTEKKEIVSEKPKEINGRELELSETVKVKARTLKVKIWDSQIEDGDIISIYIGDKKVLDHYSLKTAPKEFEFELPAGANEHFLTVYSDDFGRSEPNTAALIINDGSKEYRIDMVSGRKKQDTLKIITE